MKIEWDKLLSFGLVPIHPNGQFLALTKTHTFWNFTFRSPRWIHPFGWIGSKRKGVTSVTPFLLHWGSFLQILFYGNLAKTLSLFSYLCVIWVIPTMHKEQSGDMSRWFLKRFRYVFQKKGNFNRPMIQAKHKFD